MCTTSTPQKYQNTTALNCSHSTISNSPLDTIRNNSLISESVEFDKNLTKQEFNRKGLVKKARVKHFSYFLHSGLLALNSPLHDEYKGALNCGQFVLVDEEGRSTSWYCKKKHCLICSRMRTAQKVEKYLPILRTFESPQFVTLNRKNIGVNDLEDEATSLIKTMQKVFKRLNYLKVDVKGFRTFEGTYNERSKEFNLHFHLVVDTLEGANALKREWLRINTKEGFTIDDKAQDIRPIGTNVKDMLEVCKYSTKVINADPKNKSKSINYWAIDRMNRAFKGIRNFQTFGFVLSDYNHLGLDEIEEDFLQGVEEKLNSNEVEVVGSECVESGEFDKGESFIEGNKPPSSGLYKYQKLVTDWVNIETGEMLTGYKPPERIVEIFRSGRFSP